MPQTYRKRRLIYAAQISAVSVCLEQYANILAHVLNRRVVYLERRVESLAVCMPHMDNKCDNFYAKDLTLNAERQRLPSQEARSRLYHNDITNKSQM